MWRRASIVLSLGVTAYGTYYHFQKKTDKDQVDMVLPVSNTSSGQLSIVPVLPVLDNKNIYPMLNPSDTISPYEAIVIINQQYFEDNFEKKMVMKLFNLLEKDLNQSLKIVIANMTDPLIREKLKLDQSENPFVLFKNNYSTEFKKEQHFIYSHLESIFRKISRDLAKVKIVDSSTISFYLKYLSEADPNISQLIFICDPSNQQQFRNQCQLSKALEQVLQQQRITLVQLIPMDRKAAIKAKILNKEDAIPNSLHLLRKHNQFTPKLPNLFINFEDSQPQKPQSSVGYHILKRIPLPKHKYWLTNYLDQIQTFRNEGYYQPFICQVRVNRNKINMKTYHQLIKMFGEIKGNKQFTNVQFLIEFGKIPYQGSENIKNHQWQICMRNITALQRQSEPFYAKTRADLNRIGITGQDYKNSYEYLYEHNTINKQLLIQFLNQSMSGSHPQYYKSQQVDCLHNVPKLTGLDYLQTINQDKQDYLVYEYCDDCPYCKKFSPLISPLYFHCLYSKQSNYSAKEKFTVRRCNIDLNIVRQKLMTYSVPSLNFFKHQWKQYGHVRFPNSQLSRGGLQSLYNFCQLTSEIKSIPWKSIDQHIRTASQPKLKQMIQGATQSF